jgi:bifunctional DNase/RNase
MKCQRCDAPATIHITEADGCAAVGEWHLCEPHAGKYFADKSGPRAPRASPSPRSSEAIRAGNPGRLGLHGEVALDIVQVVINEVHDQQMVMFQEVDGPRRFPLVCGIFEATSLDRRLKQMPSPRPLTHDGWASTITALGAELQDVKITDLRDHTYFAEIRLRRDGQVVTVDVRPSDALVIAVTCRVPIVIAESVLIEVCGE